MHKKRLISFLKKQKDEIFKFLLLNIDKMNSDDTEILYSLLVTKNLENIKKIKNDKESEISNLFNNIKQILLQSKKITLNYKEKNSNNKDNEEAESLLLKLN